ncbi:hypothetical protein FF1_013453 [Malus domestica]
MSLLETEPRDVGKLSGGQDPVQNRQEQVGNSSGFSAAFARVLQRASSFATCVKSSPTSTSRTRILYYSMRLNDLRSLGVLPSSEKRRGSSES